MEPIDKTFRYFLLTVLLLCITLPALSATVQPPRLLMAREIEGSCSIEVWDVSLDQARVLAQPSKCPPRLFATQKGDILFFAIDGIASLISIDDVNVQPTSIKLPSLDFGDYRGALSVQPTEDYLAQSFTRKMNVTGIGFHSSGSVGVHATLGMAADDSYNYLLLQNGEAWEVTDELWCHRFEANCYFDELHFQSTEAWASNEQRQIWHDEVRKNPFFVSEEVQADVIGGTTLLEVRRFFRIDDKNVQLLYSTRPGPDTGATLTFSIELSIDGQGKQILSTGQCLASVAGKYILVQQFWGGTLEVRSLKSGTSIFGPLIHAVWINRTPVISE